MRGVASGDVACAAPAMLHVLIGALPPNFLPISGVRGQLRVARRDVASFDLRYTPNLNDGGVKCGWCCYCCLSPCRVAARDPGRSARRYRSAGLGLISKEESSSIDAFANFQTQKIAVG
jgi:hypothetical protein